MSYSNFAMHCPGCSEISEPVQKNRQPNGNIKSTYRCENGHTWQQQFTVSHEAPLIDKPEPKEKNDLPDPPDTEVMEWDSDERSEFIEAYGEEAYKSLVAKHFKEGEAFYERPEDEPAMPQDDNPKFWSKRQRNNFVDKYGHDKYRQRFQEQMEKDFKKERAEA